MFDKDLFCEILKKINNEYDSMTEFAKAASLDRSYISKYINKKLNNPPTPKILSGIANASKSLVTYDELMDICGYLNLSGLHDINLNNEELNVLNKMLLDYKDFISSNHNSFHRFDEQKYLKKFSEDEKNKIIIAFRRNSLKIILNNSEKRLDNTNYFEFVSEDDAMYPLLDIGDVALVYKQSYIEDGATFLINMDNKNTIRKFILDETKKYYKLIAMNGCYKDIIIKKDELSKIKILGKVVQAKNKSAFKFK